MGNLSTSALATTGVSIINRYVLLFVCIMGFVGNSLNVYIFTRPNLRQNTCVIYLLITSLLNIMTLFFGASVRCLTSYGYDLTLKAPVFCKIRFYLTYVTQSAALWLLVFACFDRYLSSSMNIQRRRWLNREKTYRIILCVLIFTSLSYTQMFYCFDTTTNTAGSCTFRNQMCSFIDTASFLIFNSFLPPSLMFGFGVAMLMNIKQSRQRIEDVFTGTGLTPKINRRDRQLISVLLLQVRFFELREISVGLFFSQVALVLLCMFPIAAMKLYLSVSIHTKKSTDQTNIDNFTYQFTAILTYVDASALFFIYTLYGKIFRLELFRACQRIRRMMLPDANERFWTTIDGFGSLQDTSLT